MVVKWLALLPHSRKVPCLIPQVDEVVPFCVEFAYSPVWLSSHSPKTCDLSPPVTLVKLAVGVNMGVSDLSISVSALWWIGDQYPRCTTASLQSVIEKRYRKWLADWRWAKLPVLLISNDTALAFLTPQFCLQWATTEHQKHIDMEPQINNNSSSISVRTSVDPEALPVPNTLQCTVKTFIHIYGPFRVTMSCIRRFFQRWNEENPRTWWELITRSAPGSIIRHGTTLLVYAILVVLPTHLTSKCDAG